MDTISETYIKMHKAEKLNIERLKKVVKLLTLVMKSGTLIDVNEHAQSKVGVARFLLEVAISIQEKYHNKEK